MKFQASALWHLFEIKCDSGFPKNVNLLKTFITQNYHFVYRLTINSSL